MGEPLLPSTDLVSYQDTAGKDSATSTVQRIYLENQVGAVNMKSESNEEAPYLHNEVYNSHNERSE